MAFYFGAHDLGQTCPNYERRGLPGVGDDDGQAEGHHDGQDVREPHEAQVGAGPVEEVRAVHLPAGALAYMKTDCKYCFTFYLGAQYKTVFCKRVDYVNAFYRRAHGRIFNN